MHVYNNFHWHFPMFSPIIANSACKLMAKQKVALECLSYHATATQDQTLKLASDPIKNADEYKLYSFKFIGMLEHICLLLFVGFLCMLNIAKTKYSIFADFELKEEETCRATIRMFVDFNLVSQFHIPYDVSFLLNGIYTSQDHKKISWHGSHAANN